MHANKVCSLKFTLQLRYKKLYAPPPIYKVNQRYAAFTKASRTIKTLRNQLEIHMVTLEDVGNKEKP